MAAWIVDDTGFPKKGQHSVGVARQYCGVLGKQDNCHVAVTVSVANDAASLPVAYQLYLPEEWVLIEWPRDDAAPTNYCLSTLPASTSLADLVHLAKLRWRIERDYQELKDELGLDHFGGRGWRGFHHHGALCIAAYAFLAAERARLSPPEPLPFLTTARLPKGFTPRGAPGAA